MTPRDTPHKSQKNVMISKCLIVPGIATGVLLLTIGLYAEQQDGAGEKSGKVKSSVSEETSKPDGIDVALARDRAKQMHEIYSSTLDVIHHRYFHGDRATVPARAMEDIFRDMKRRSNADAHWISVNTKAMSIDHDPKTDFEKRAAKELAEGKAEIEEIEGGIYWRAGAISLHAGCLSCHEGLFRTSSNKPRFAGLVVNIPIQKERPTTQ